MINSVLVVCTGNICRSPMAEGLFRQALQQVAISSAGTAAMVGYGADTLAVQIMAERGIDISAHRARMLTDLIVRDADIILVMSEQHKHYFGMQYSYARGKVFLLGEADKMEIPDPVQQSSEVFRQVFSLIEHSVSKWVMKINNLSRKIG